MDGKIIAVGLIDVFLFINQKLEVFSLKQYYVIRSTDCRDERLGVVDALSLEEAHAIVKVRFQESMQKGETLHTFQIVEPLSFDENHRLIFPDVAMMSIGKWE